MQAPKARETSTGLNANGKTVKPGQFAMTKHASGKDLPPQPETMSQELIDATNQMDPDSPYVQSVWAAYTMNEIAAKARKKYPSAKTFTFGLDYSECDDDDFDEADPSCYLDEIITEDGTSLEFDSSFDEIRDDLQGIFWKDHDVHGSAGRRTTSAATIIVDIDQALDIPSYLKDPNLNSRESVPSKIDTDWLVESASTIAEVEYRLRVEMNNPIFGSPAAFPQALEQRKKELTELANTRIRELQEAGLEH